MAAVPDGSQFLVNAIEDGTQYRPSLAALADGGFVVAWQDTSGIGSPNDVSDDVRFARYDAFGNRINAGVDTLINTEVDGAQFDPVVASFGNGKFVVAWTDGSEAGPDFNNRAIKTQIFNANGSPSGDEITVNATFPLSQHTPSITVLNSDRFVVTWTSEMEDASGTTDIIGRVFNSAGNPVTNEFTVNTQKVGNQDGSAVHALSSGGFAVVWDDRESSAVTGNHLKSFVRFYNANGAAQGGPKVASDAISADPQQISLTELTDGRVVVVYTNLDGFNTGDGSGGTIDYRIYNPATGTFGSRVLVNTTTTNDQTESKVAALHDGQFVVVWTDNSKTGMDTNFQAVRMQVFDATGTKVGGEVLVNSQLTTFEQQNPSITVLNDGRFVVAWEDNSHAGADADAFSIRSKIFDARIAAVDFDGDNAADNYKGTKFADHLDGLGGNDQLLGGGGNDSVFGGLGIDLLRGDNGNDKVDGGDGNDNLQGGAGNDSLVGAAGNDILNGNEGKDTLTGGLGNDTFVFTAVLNQNTNVDRITDFNVAADTFKLDNAVFLGLTNTGGHLTAAQFHIGASAADPSDHVIYNSATGQLIYDANGSSANGTTVFATLATGLMLTAADFVVI